MILSFIIKKIKSQILSLTKPLPIIMSVVFLAISVGYGILFGFVVNELAGKSNTNFTPEEFLNYLLIVIFIFSMMLTVMPAYKPMQQFFPRYYPLSTLQKYSLSMLADFVSPFFFYIILFLLTAFSFMEHYGIEFLTSGLIVLFGSQLLKRQFQYCIDFKINKYGYLLTAVVFSLIVLVLYTNPYLLFYNDIKGISILIILLIAGYVMESMVLESRQHGMNSKAHKGSIYWKLIINNKKARMLLLMGFVFQVVFMLIMQFANKGMYKDSIFWLFVTPALLFNYVFNNTWGFWKGLWLNYELRTGSYIDMLKTNIRIIAPPLFVNAIIFVPAAIYISGEVLFTFTMYITATLVLIPMSFIISMFPVFLKSTFTMKGNTSQVGSFVNAGVVLLLVVIRLSDWLYLLVPVYIAASLILYKIAVNMYPKRKYIIVEKLLKP